MFHGEEKNVMGEKIKEEKKLIYINESVNGNLAEWTSFGFCISEHIALAKEGI